MAKEINVLSFGDEDYSIIDTVYPVGSIYMSVNSANPGTIFGGTWEQIKGRFLLGTGVPDDNSNAFWGTDLTYDGTNKFNEMTPGSTGGESRHTLSQSEMPAHSHTPLGAEDWGIAEYRSVPNKSGIWSGPIQSGDGLMLGAVNDGNTYIALRSNTGSTGGNVAHNNMPPYFAVYIWKRTA